MICRDNADTIETALKSAEGVFDEIIVCDTGSTDNTIPIVKKYTDKIVRIPWEDDFAKARNYSLDLATSDLVFYMDSDDELPEDTKLAIRIIAANNDKNVAYCFKIHSVFKSELTKGWINDFDHLKLFPNRKEIRFNNKGADGHLHESVVDAILKLPIEIRSVNFSVIHHGYETEEIAERKLFRDIRLCMNIPGRYYQFRIEKCIFSYVNNFLTMWAPRFDGIGNYDRVDYHQNTGVGVSFMPDVELDNEQLVKIYKIANEMYTDFKDERKSAVSIIETELLRMEHNYSGLRLEKAVLSNK